MLLAIIEVLNVPLNLFFGGHYGLMGLLLLLLFTTWMGFGTRWLLFFFLLVASMMAFFSAGVMVGLADKGNGDPGVLVTDFPSLVALLTALGTLLSCIFLAASPQIGAFLGARRKWRQDLNDPIAQRGERSANKP